MMSELVFALLVGYACGCTLAALAIAIVDYDFVLDLDGKEFLAITFLWPIYLIAAIIRGFVAVPRVLRSIPKICFPKVDLLGNAKFFVVLFRKIGGF